MRYIFTLCVHLVISSICFGGENSSGGMMTIPDIRLNEVNFSELTSELRNENIEIVIPEKFLGDFQVKKVSENSVLLESLFGDKAKIKKVVERENFLKIDFYDEKISIKLP